MTLSYKSSGVDLDLYEQSMARLPELIARTRRPGVMDLPGGFAGLFRLSEAGRYEDPVLVSGTDGVGTKLKVAFTAQKYDTVGIDLVAMCVNDVLCLGAEPLFFLDYVALDRDDPDRLAQLVSGVAEGCRQAGCALLGGETAIMPAVYAQDEFDMAGFCVGVADRSKLIDGKAIRPGDVVIGLPSSGFHSNGYSLIRKAVFEHAGLAIDDHIEELGRTVADVLLTPTTIYAKPIVSLLKAVPGAVHGMAHITGGGLAENLERILPENCRAVLRRGWPEPPEFGWLQRLGGIEESEMDRVFNRGVGFVVVVEQGHEAAVSGVLREEGLKPFLLGKIVEGARKASLSGEAEV
ncbi:MAG: phosphoribosylformylglycinamidine cyclo-ligase [Planctomycetota bacterium]|nr:phosphoribosylformylglycinamidine cyclo-ligase [Planctomycetota bacterium]